MLFITFFEVERGYLFDFPGIKFYKDANFH